MRKLIRLSVVLFFISVLFIQAFSWDDFPVFESRVKNLSVFKSGIGFYVKSGRTDLKNGYTKIEDVPLPLFGTLWFWSENDDDMITEVIAYNDKILIEELAVSIPELLKVNKGRKVILTVMNQKYTGILKSVPEKKVQEKDAAQRMIDYYTQPSYYGAPYYNPVNVNPNEIIMLETENGMMAIKKGDIQMIEFPAGVNTTIKNERTVRRLRIRVASPRESADIGMCYLQKGITWVPSYIVNIKSPTKVEITMKALLVNDIEDLINTEVDFIVGFPNIAFEHVISPMGLAEDVFRFLKRLYASPSYQDSYFGLSNIMAQSVSFAPEYGNAIGDYSTQNIPNIKVQGEEDLFFYKKEKVTLKKGERGYYHIFTNEVSSKHIYTYEVPDTIDKYKQQYNYGQPKEQVPEQVWHCLELENKTKYPWTTASAFVVKEGKPIAEGKLNYTPIGTSNRIKLTSANDVKTRYNEYETERENNIKINYSTHSLVTVKGEIYLKNAKSEKIDMEITKSLTGDVIESDNQAKVKEVAEGLKQLNKNSKITWNITLKPGQEITLKYMYKVYI